MAYDMQTWQEKDLGWIARKMDNIQRRLDLKRGGKNKAKYRWPSAGTGSLSPTGPVPGRVSGWALSPPPRRCVRKRTLFPEQWIGEQS